MERYEVGDDERLAAMVEAADRGDEVLITRDGVVVAEIHAKMPAIEEPRRPFDMEALRRLHERLPSMRVDDATALVREMRDMDDH